ncbi:Ms4533A family Cys-rich leader peptide [Streptomyces sp. 8L]
MTPRWPLKRVAFTVALIGVTEHCVADILCP